jgi:hypothetical protein
MSIALIRNYCIYLVMARKANNPGRSSKKLARKRAGSMRQDRHSKAKRAGSGRPGRRRKARHVGSAGSGGGGQAQRAGRSKAKRAGGGRSSQRALQTRWAARSSKRGARAGQTSERIARVTRAKRTLPDTVFELSDALETPLRRTQDLVRALHYVGYGLTSLQDDSAMAVNGLAEALENHVHEMRVALGFERERQLL